ELDIDGERTFLGALADSVQEVITLEADQIEPPPKIGTRLDTEFIRGMGKNNDDLIIILDINRVFSSTELEKFQATEKNRIIKEDTTSFSSEYITDEMSV
ncbi:MAG: chemotaxis protein CheW, partial [Deltaproteobacteria bacterium]|nr:chemotaxis protein CheW [Deltaproteobacteria bacterium]